MYDIQGLGQESYLPNALRGGAMDASRLATVLSAESTPGDLPGHLGSITNGRGQTLFDIRDQLKSAVIEALANVDGTGDKHAVVRDAIYSVLEANGFDPAALEAAKTGFNPMQSMAGRASLFAAANQGMDSLDLDAMFGDDDEKNADDFLMALLGQFRPGINLDLVI